MIFRLLAAIWLILSLNAAWIGAAECQDEGSGGNSESAAEADSGRDDSEEIEVGEVEVEGEKPASAESLPGEDFLLIDIEDFLIPGESLGDVLDTLGGVEVRGLGGGLDMTTFSIRGAGAHQTDILLEGAPLSPATGGVFDLSLLPAWFVQSALVTRGPGSIGGKALAGELDLRLANDTGTSFCSGRGSFGTYSAMMRGGWNAGNSNFVMAIGYDSADGDFTYGRRDGKTYTRSNNERERVAVALSWQTKNAARDDSAFLLAADRSGGVPGLSEFPTPSAHQDDTLFLAGFSSTDKSFEKGELTWTGYSRVQHTGFGDPSPYLGNAVYADQSEYAAGAAVSFRRPSGGGIFGAKISIDGAVLSDDSYGNPERRTIAATLWREFYAGKAAFSAALSGEAASDGPVGWRGKLGMERKLGAGLSLAGSAARSFRRPDFAELYYPESGFIGGNPELFPETGYTFDFGPRFRGSKLDASLVGFIHRFSESIEFVPVSAYRLRAENTGGVRSRGVSLDIQAAPADGWKLDGSFTFLDAEYLDGGLPLAGRSPRKWSVGISRESANWQVSASFLHRSSTPVDRFGSLYVGAAGDLSAALVFRPDDSWRISVSGFNLLDEDIRDSLDFPRPGRSFFLSVNREV
ncbi:MAG: TonB-dependent receptor [bacterium]|jgi:outer membrane receptor protein involved in Fe transport